MSVKLKEFQEIIGYKFNNKALLKQALIHSSYANEKGMGKKGSNERLEFLGDAVLELVSSEFLYEKYKDKTEGELSKLRASFVCEAALNFCSKQIRLGEFVLLGKGEETTGGRERPSIISDCFEALIGAVYLDGGFANAKELILNYILNDVDNKVFFYDSKTILQEIVQKDGANTLEYKLLEEAGPDHEKLFSSAVYIDGKMMGKASGYSKKEAEQMAAFKALEKLGAIKKDFK